MVDPIDIDELDKENRGWTVNYVAGIKERLAAEEAAEAPDAAMIAYLKQEVATYEELLERTSSKKGG